MTSNWYVPRGVFLSDLSHSLVVVKSTHSFIAEKGIYYAISSSNHEFKFAAHKKWKIQKQ